ncbi:flavodoxin family protein [Chelativorans sp. ZYF759]|uniref:NAD(P)H-dependent oxidoreductase n=1 Tax=Chelativorans sp. ZYF759 TaxID=2692213 RepID=UPI00145CE227|nr:flavodoxin family protein [Chelativorans sp. ZYF759]
MNCLVVFAHPLPDSLNGRFLKLVLAELEAAGHQVTCLDLYEEDYEPRLSRAERAAHYAADATARVPSEHAGLLQEADALVLVFPTWWFGLPAILKGWIDRTFAPGVAFHHGSDGGAIRPALTRLRHFVSFTTLGSPWWIDTLVMWQPVRRMLKIAIAKGCAPQARFAYLALHAAEAIAAGKVEAHEARIRSVLSELR